MAADLVQHLIPLQPEQGVPEWWSDLYHKSLDASIFLGPEWLRSWIDVYGADFTGHWVRWQERDRTVGGCLLLKRTVWWRFIPLPTVFVNVAAETTPLSPWSEYNQALFVEGYEVRVAEALAQLIGTMAWTRFELWGYESNNFSQRLLEKLPTTTVQSREERAPYVDLQAFGGKEYEATISSKTRSQIRRCRRMYEEQDGPVTVEFAQSATEALEFLGQLANFHNAIWRSRDALASFEVKEFREFHERVVERLWPTQGVDLLRVRAQQKVIGYLLNFKRAGKVYCYQSGFVQEEDPHLKPGLLTHACAIAEYSRQGLREYDLLGGDSRYKRSLTKSYRTLMWSTCYRNSMYARALWAGRRLKARLKPEADANDDPESGAASSVSESGLESSSPQ
jgi:CelD/BcsL family acetyltransferase involved in cellulose biosynthesis